jgi:hypothetical protein
MSAPRTPRSTLNFVEPYCALYRDLVADVRSFNHVKWLHVGLMSEIPQGVVRGPGPRVRSTSGNAFDHGCAQGTGERRDIGDLICGPRGAIRYDQRTTAPQGLPAASTWFVLTTLAQAALQDVGNGEGRRTWLA